MLVKSKTTWTEVFPSLFDSGSLRRITKSSLYVCCAHWYSPQSSLKPQLLKQLQQLKPSFLGELIFHTQLLLFIPKSSRPMRDHSHNSASKWNIYMWLYIFLCPSVIFAHCWSEFTDFKLMKRQKSNLSRCSTLTHVRETSGCLLKATS